MADATPEHPAHAGSSDAQGTRTVADLRAARETRANEALKMKDEQLRILQEQNNTLLGNLDRVEEEATRIQQERLISEEENRSLREQVFECQGRARAAEAALKKVQTDASDRDKQLRIMTDQNSELLRLLEQEEAQVAKLAADKEVAVNELEALRSKYGSLLTTAKSHEEMAGRAAREGQLRAEEVRLLRAEVEQLKQQNSELKMKTQVELESLEEQLRVRKEKQYQLLEKLQAQEEAKRQAEDQVTGMEDKLRALHSKSTELETQLQVEARSRRSAEESNKILLNDIENLRGGNRELQLKVEKSDGERVRMEAEARDSGEQLREMAEKVFQLLERLKLAELAKSKAMEALKRKDQELVSMKKKNERLIKESTKEGKARVKCELDIKVLQDQALALKKHNAQLAARTRDEVKLKLKEHGERVETQEKVRTLGGRLTFLLNKMQQDEEAKVLLSEDVKKTEAQVRSLTGRAQELQRKLEEAGESNRIITQALRLKQEELEQLTIRHEHLHKKMSGWQVNDRPEEERPEVDGIGNEGGGDGNVMDPAAIISNHGKGVFFVESKPTQGMLLVKPKRSVHKKFIEAHDINGFLKQAQRSLRFKEMAIEKLCHVYGLIVAQEMEKEMSNQELAAKVTQIDALARKNSYLQERVGVEEDAKRRTLLRYVHAVKAAAAAAPAPGDTTQVLSQTGAAAAGRPGRGAVQLPESGVTDEEVHAVAALLRGNTTITELSLRGNEITDEGARALAAVLGGNTALRSVDLRGNRISKQGIRALAEALERTERVRHVYVHAGGKIEALGTGVWAGTGNQCCCLGSTQLTADYSCTTGANGAGGEEEVTRAESVPMVTVETVCVVDVRENAPPPASEVNAAGITAAMGDYTRPLPDGVATTGQPPIFATTVLPGAVSKKQKAKEKGDKAKRAAKRAQRRMAEDEDRRMKLLEGGWQGRSGGMDLRATRTMGAESASPVARKRRDLPQLNTNRGGSPPRSSSAPGFKDTTGTSTRVNPLAQSVGFRKTGKSSKLQR
ncbi:unnamed protein product [Chrysoparadoxa australica]